MKQRKRRVQGRLTGAYRAGHPAGRYPGWRLAFDFDEAVIKALKAAVPAIDRSYDPETHEWWVREERQEVILRLFPSFEGYLAQLPLL